MSLFFFFALKTNKRELKMSIFSLGSDKNLNCTISDPISVCACKSRNNSTPEYRRAEFGCSTLNSSKHFIKTQNFSFGSLSSNNKSDRANMISIGSEQQRDAAIKNDRIIPALKLRSSCAAPDRKGSAESENKSRDKSEKCDKREYRGDKREDMVDESPCNYFSWKKRIIVQERVKKMMEEWSTNEKDFKEYVAYALTSALNELTQLRRRLEKMEEAKILE